MATIITADTVKKYLGIDYADEMVDANILRCIQTADTYLKGSIGEDYQTDDPRAVELTLIIVADLYNNRNLQAAAGGNVSANTRKLVDDISLQLRLELRSRSAEGDDNNDD